MVLETIVTNIGLAKIASAIANGVTVNLAAIALGDGGGNPVTPSQTATELVREVWRGGLTNLTNDPNNPDRYVVAETIVPTDVGGWAVREVGVFDDSGALIAVGNFPDTYKPLPTEGAARDLVVRIYLAVSSTSAVELRIDPAIVLASRQWVTDNFTVGAQIPGGNTGYVLRKKSNADGDFEWVDIASGTTILVAPREEVQTLVAGQTVVTLAVCTTEGVAIYLDGVRLRGPAVADPQFSIQDDTTLTLATPATAGQKLHAAQNEPASELDYLRGVNNLGEIKAAGAPAQQKALENLGLPNTLGNLAKAVGELLMPVGHIYVTVNNTNPAALLGFGTWARWGEGRSLTGFSTSDADFNAVEKTGGNKTVTLTVAQLPAHTHNNAAQTITTTSAGAHTHATNSVTVTTTNAGSHTHAIWGNSSAGETSSAYGFANTNADRPITGDNTGAAWFTQNGFGTQLIQTAGGHTHTVTIPALTAASAGAHTHTVTVEAKATTSVGSNSPVNILQPYIVAHLWKRTA
ncbi:tail protein [Opitutaceae bacterium TAV5]|nr:tail protein [Opitutaceae bacterium TAV5]